MVIVSPFPPADVLIRQRFTFQPEPLLGLPSFLNPKGLLIGCSKLRTAAQRLIPHSWSSFYVFFRRFLLERSFVSRFSFHGKLNPFLRRSSVEFPRPVPRAKARRQVLTTSRRPPFPLVHSPPSFLAWFVLSLDSHLCDLFPWEPLIRRRPPSVPHSCVCRPERD